MAKQKAKPTPFYAIYNIFNVLIYELIDPDIQLNSNDFKFIEHFLKSTKRTQIGWHYIIDITWIYSLVKNWSRDLKILDAGGGNGPLQFLLAEMGFDITNIDMNLNSLPSQYKYRYKSEIETLQSFEYTSYMEFLSNTEHNNTAQIKLQLKRLIKSIPIARCWRCRSYSRIHDTWRSTTYLSDVPIGNVEWCQANLCKMPEIPSNYFDAVVSLSALEHIPYDVLDSALTEIHRVLKPNARWAITTSATEKDLTWWHEPSQSNCFSTTDIEKIFRAKCYGYQNPKNIWEKYNQCSYLKNNLADFYKKSSRFGMPWGIWKPKYIPVGLSTP